jgi:hypothetical protein
LLAVRRLSFLSGACVGSSNQRVRLARTRPLFRHFKPPALLISGALHALRTLNTHLAVAARLVHHSHAGSLVVDYLALAVQCVECQPQIMGVCTLAWCRACPLNLKVALPCRSDLLCMRGLQNWNLQRALSATTLRVWTSALSVAFAWVCLCASLFDVARFQRLVWPDKERVLLCAR